MSKSSCTTPLYYSNTYSFATDYLPTHKGGSEYTKRNYKIGLKMLGRYSIECANIPLDKLTYVDVNYDFLLQFRNHMHDEWGLSLSSCNLSLAANKAYIKYSAFHDIALQQIWLNAKNVPGFAIPIVHQPIIEDENALRILLASPPQGHRGLRDSTILNVLYNGALRADELVSLHYNEVGIDSDNPSVTIHGKGHKERTIYLSRELKPLLVKYRTVYHTNPNPTDFFFYSTIGGIRKKMTTRNLELRVEKYANVARQTLQEQFGDLAQDLLPEKVTPHTLRRTRGTNLLRDGVPLEDVSEFLGHSSVEVTRNHYAFSSKEQKIEVSRHAAQFVANASAQNEPNDAKNEPQKLWINHLDDIDKAFGL